MKKIRGRFYVEETLDGWQVVDAKYALTLGCQNKTDAYKTASFCREFVRRHGDIDFCSFPYSLDDGFSGMSEDVEVVDATY